mgnify:CR=1 FL=1
MEHQWYSIPLLDAPFISQVLHVHSSAPLNSDVYTWSLMLMYDPCCSIMILDAHMWSLMLTHDPCCSLVILEFLIKMLTRDSWCSLIIYDVYLRFVILTCDSWCLFMIQMLTHDSKCSIKLQMLQMLKSHLIRNISYSSIHPPQIFLFDGMNLGNS